MTAEVNAANPLLNRAHGTSSEIELLKNDLEKGHFQQVFAPCFQGCDVVRGAATFQTRFFFAAKPSPSRRTPERT